MLQCTLSPSNLSCNLVHAGTTPSANQPEGRINVRFRRLEPEEDRSLATCNIGEPQQHLAWHTQPSLQSAVPAVGGPAGSSSVHSDHDNLAQIIDHDTPLVCIHTQCFFCDCCMCDTYLCAVLCRGLCAVVMEYCDKGSLRHAMKRGVFHKRLGSTSVAVDLCAIVQVCVCGGGAGEGV